MPTIGDCGKDILIIAKRDEVTGCLIYWGTDHENDRWVWYRREQICQDKNRLNVFLSFFYAQQHIDYLEKRDPEPMVNKPEIYKYCCDLPDIPDCETPETSSCPTSSNPTSSCPTSSNPTSSCPTSSNWDNW